MIDLYYAHRLERGRPVEEIVDTLAGLVKAGKVRAIGLSEVSAENPAPRGFRSPHCGGAVGMVALDP